MLPNNKMTRGKIDHLISWGQFIRTNKKDSWTAWDEILLNFLREYRKEVTLEYYTPKTLRRLRIDLCPKTS